MFFWLTLSLSLNLLLGSGCILLIYLVKKNKNKLAEFHQHPTFNSLEVQIISRLYDAPEYERTVADINLFIGVNGNPSISKTKKGAD